MQENELAALLDVTARWARRRGLTAEQIEDAKTAAWYQASRCPKTFPLGHWARLAIRRIIQGRGLPGCDCIRRMRGQLPRDQVPVELLSDHSPTPLAILIHRETWRAIVQKQSPRVRRLLAMRQAGRGVDEISQALGVSPSRVSQLARLFYEEMSAELND